MVPVCNLLVTVVTLSLWHTAQGSYPFDDPSLPWSDRVDDLVSRLTLEEIAHFSIDKVRTTPPNADRLGIHAYRIGTECLRGYVTTNTTAWPQALGISATFSRDVVYNMSQAVSYELRGKYNQDQATGTYGQHGLSCFSPVINIMRHPLWGRNQETYGECPFLSGELVTQYVHGLQGDDPRYIRANAGCKHFDVHGGPEDIPSSRFSFDSKVSERDWRMTFLPQFKACVKAGTYNLMCSYNRVNGVPACANSELLIDILRKEWNFTGYIISDQGAIQNIMTQHKYTTNEVDTVVAAIKSGCNIELTSDELIYDNQITAVLENKLTEKEVRDNIKPVFYTRMRLGEFDPPQMNPYSKISADVILSPEHQELATRAAVKSFVLLKNKNNYLPIKKTFDRLAVVGPFAQDGDMFGDYAAQPDKKFITTPLDGLRRLSNDTRYAAGCGDAHCNTYNQTSIKEAVTGAQFVFVCLGTGVTIEAEGNDRASLDLPGQQLQLLKDAIFYSREAPLVVLLFNAGPLDVTFAKLSEDVQGIVACFLPAMTAGEALYRMVTMSTPEAVPAGRLPATWPAQLQQVPPISNYTMAGRTYRYYNGDPLYPFGYGLSYSQFRYETLTVFPATVKAGNDVNVEVTVYNKGPYDADEVVQIYMSWGSASVPVPRWQLVAFDRQMIGSGKTRSFQFTVTGEQMAVWTDKFVIEPGTMKLYASGQQPFQRTSTKANTLSVTFSVTGATDEDAPDPVPVEGDEDNEVPAEDVKNISNENNKIVKETNKDERLLFKSMVDKNEKEGIMP